MWKTLIFNDNYYLFQVSVSDADVSIKLSDLQSVWSKKITKNNLIELFTKLNPLLDQNAEEMYDSCLSMLKDNLIQSLTFDDTTQECSVKFKHFFDELPLKLDVILEKQTGSEFLKQVTVPIVQTIQYLELKQKKLERLLLQKDKELDEYKHEYGNISRKLVETRKYEADTDIKPDLVLKVFSDDQDFNKLFAQKHGDVQQLFPEIKEPLKQEKRKLELAPTKYKKMKYYKLDADNT